MIEHIEALPNTFKINELQDCNTLTLERNSVLIARVSKDYDTNDLQIIRQSLEKTFPSNKVLVIWDDIDFTIIHDKTVKKERPISEYEYDTYHNY